MPYYKFKVHMSKKGKANAALPKKSRMRITNCTKEQDFDYKNC